MKVACVILPDYKLYKPFSNTPEGVLRIHALLKMGGYDSTLLDFRGCENGRRLYEQVKSNLYEPIKGFDWCRFNIVMVSATTAQGNILNHFTSLCDKNQVVILGGTHVNALCASKSWTEKQIKFVHPHVDIFATGYYWTVKDISELVNFAVRKYNSDSQYIYQSNNLESDKVIIPLPYEDLGDNSVSRTGGVIRNGEIGEILTQNMLFSVGCVYDCKFCFNEFKRCGRGQPEAVIKELKRRCEKYKIQGIKVNDDDPFHSLSWNDKFISELRNSGIELVYLASTRADVQRQDYKKLKQLVELHSLGLQVIGLGLEWGSDDVLAKMNKRITVEDVKHSIKKLNEYTDAEILLYSIFGLPPFNEKTINEMIEFVYWAKGKIKHISMTNFVPLIGTDMYENEKHYNLENRVYKPKSPSYFTEPIDWEKFYFAGGFTCIRSLPANVSEEEYLNYKLQMYKALKECGFLREETEEDAKKEGCVL